ncbi:hypothetical protein [Thalassotalea agariperforans]
MSKISHYFKNSKVGLLPFLATVFMLMSVLYSYYSKNIELTKLIREQTISNAIDVPGHYITLKDIYCLPSLPSSSKEELNEIIRLYDLKVYALLYNKEIPESRVKDLEYVLDYLSENCAKET